MTDVEKANDEGADPTKDIKRQNPGATTASDAIGKDDPHKVEKLAKIGHGEDPDAGSE